MKPLPRSFARLAGSLLLGGLICGSACVRAPVRKTRGKTTSFVATVQQNLDRARPERTEGRLVLFSDSEAVGIDPNDGEELWRRPVRAFGPPSTYGGVVVVPVYGHRALALEAETGAIRWDSPLPGQVLTGLSVSERWVVVTALMSDPKRRRRSRPQDDARSVVGALSLADGRTRWTRPSNTLLGVPGAAGRAGFVPAGDDVIAFGLRSGRTLARLGARNSAAYHRVERHGDTLLAADGDSLVDLGLGTRYAFEQEHAALYEGVEGIEPGLGHHGGVLFRLLPAAGAGAPRNALFLGRRVVIFVRLDERGRSISSRWVHLRFDQKEYVDMQATRANVILVRDDGALVHLDRKTGRLHKELDGRVIPLGAAFVGTDPSVDDSDSSVDRQTNVDTLIGVLEDPDPRLLPAQRLALQLLWRDEHPATRAHVHDVAVGVIRPDDGAESETLREYAQQLRGGVWGRGDAESVLALTERLTPGRLHGDALRDATLEAVSAGGPAVVPALVALLSEPSLQPAELDHIAKALRDLADPRGVDGAAEFIVQYHADPEIVDAGKSIYYAAELLLHHAQPELPDRADADAAARARATLIAMLDDEFTVPSLREFIRSRIEPWNQAPPAPGTPVADAASEPAGSESGPASETGSAPATNADRP